MKNKLIGLLFGITLLLPVVAYGNPLSDLSKKPKEVAVKIHHLGRASQE
jgi:hypothetical protein